MEEVLAEDEMQEKVGVTEEILKEEVQEDLEEEVEVEIQEEEIPEVMEEALEEEEGISYFKR